MPDYAGLKAELAKPTYADLTDEQISAALVASKTASVNVTTGAVEGYFRSRMLMGGIQKFVSAPPTGADPALVEGISEFMGMLASPHVQTVQMSDPTVNAAVTQILAGMVSAGLISATNQSDLLVLATTSTTIAQTYGFSDDIHDMSQEILAARRWS